MSEEKTLINMFEEMNEAINKNTEAIKAASKVVEKMLTEVIDRGSLIRVEVKTSTVEEIREALKPFITATMIKR